jgi:hypothetical protein
MVRRRLLAKRATGALLTGCLVFLILAGAAGASVAVNGTVTQITSLNVPSSVLAVSNDDGTIYLADAAAHEVLQVNAVSDQQTVLAGDG